MPACIETFKNFCDSKGWHAAFHQTNSELLARYKDFGFTSFRIGDEAMVDLRAFSLEGSGRKPLRNIFNKFSKGGYAVRRIDPPLNQGLVFNLKQISDSWLTVPGRRERTFTLGQFEEDYISSTPVYVLIEPFGNIIAFANVLPPYGKGELTLDLMRFYAAAPNSSMEFLFLKMFEDLRSRGYKRFSLGLAPLSGVQEHEEGQKSVKLAHGFLSKLNFLFHFQGLRTFKAKFANQWEPRYLVYENIGDLPLILRALNTLSEIKIVKK